MKNWTYYIRFDNKLPQIRESDFVPATYFIIGKLNEKDLSKLNNLKVLLIPIPGYLTKVNANFKINNNNLR